MMKYALEELDAFNIAFYRILIGMIFINLINFKKTSFSLRQHFELSMVGLLWMSFPFYLFAKAEETITSSLAGLINGSTPIFISLVAVLVFKNKITKTKNIFELDNYLNNILEDVKKQNNGEKVDDEKVLETYRPSAERNLKWYLIRKKIIDQEQISFSRSDIDKEIENLVSRSPNSEQEIRRFYKKPSNRQRIEDDLTEKKILEFLTQFAKIKEVEVNTKDLRGENK